MNREVLILCNCHVIRFSQGTNPHTGKPNLGSEYPYITILQDADIRTLLDSNRGDPQSLRGAELLKEVLEL